MSLHRGSVIDERYEIVDKLGSGGMGVVYKAKQVGLDREVAVKMLLPKLSEREDDRIRFQREARVMSRLRHDNAVQVFDYGEWEERLYLVMELLDGIPLRTRMVDGRPFGLQASLLVGWQIADVLAAAHELTLVHRDIKPENVMLETRADGTERVVVVDFGLAFMQAAGPELARLTATGLVSGTPQYMSPEQARGAEDLGPPADVYALGGMIYELVTGEPPFKARKMIDLVNQHLFVTPDAMRERRPELEIPHALDELVLRMLEKAPADRPTADDARTRIGQLLVGETPRGRGRPERLNEPRSRRVPTGKQWAIGHVETAGTERFDTGRFATATNSTVSVVGDLDTDRHVSLRAAHFAVHSWAPDGDAGEVILVLHGESFDAATVDAVPVVFEVARDAPIERVTELLRSGATDVVRVGAEHDQLIRKLSRAVRSRRRRGGEG